MTKKLFAGILLLFALKASANTLDSIPNKPIHAKIKNYFKYHSKKTDDSTNVHYRYVYTGTNAKTARLMKIIKFSATHTIGSGSGTLSITSMSGYSNGDTLSITPGTYGGGCALSNIHDVVITNAPSGVVTFTASCDLGQKTATFNNVTWTGTGSPTNTYGFIFDATGTFGDGPVGYTTHSGIVMSASHYQGLRINHIWFKSIVANCFDWSVDNTPTYVNTTASLKMYQTTFSYCRMDNSLQFMQSSYKGKDASFVDSIDISYNILNQTTGNGLQINIEATNYNIHHNQILYTGYNNQVGDVGAIDVLGFGQVHHNYMKGGRGYIARMIGCSLKPTVSTCYAYSNIKLGTTNYGGFDQRSDSLNFFAPQSEFFMHCNFQTVNNTIGNLTSIDNNGAGPTNGYNTPVSLFYVMDGGSTGLVKNNLVFNNVSGASGGNVAISFAAAGFANIDTSNNRYYPASGILSVLTDSNVNCGVKSGANIIGAGVHTSYATTSYTDFTFANPPPIGGEEAQSVLTSPTLVAAVGATVDNSFSVTFVDNSAWRAAITSITINGTTTTAYTLSAGNITFSPSGTFLLQTPGTKTITVNATGYPQTSVSQSIAVGAAAKINMVTQPLGPTDNGFALRTQPVVSITDQYGNATTSTATIVASATSGWVIGGSTSVTAVSGTATFTNLTSTTAVKTSTNATITFTSSGLSTVISATFIIPPINPPGCNCSVMAKSFKRFWKVG